MPGALFHLAEPSTVEITDLVGQQLGPLFCRAGDQWAGAAAQLEAAAGEVQTRVLVIECEPDGELCPAARKFQRELKKAPRLADSGATQVACLALARSACSNSAAMLGADKWNGAMRLQRLMVEQHGCALLVPMGQAEIEIEAVEENVLPWARQLAAALEAQGGAAAGGAADGAAGGAAGGESAGAAAATAAEILPRAPPSGEPSQPSPPISRVLLLSYEFTHAPFSGNGVLARSLAKALLQSGVALRVVCCRPSDGCAGASEDTHIREPEVSAAQAAALEVWAVDLAPEDGWKRVDRECAWQRFATGAASFAAAALAFAPQACVAVDWHGAGAWRAMSEEAGAEAAGAEAAQSRRLPRPLYLNFRVYSSGTAPSERGFYEAREVAALEAAAAVLALSARDQRDLSALSAAAPAPALLLPPLRGDVRALALGSGGGHSALPPAAAAAAAAAAGGGGARCFLSCVVRLSPEKEPMRFVELCEALGGARLAALGLTPLLCGAASDEGYAARVRARLLAAHPAAVVVESFLGPQALGAVFARTALNVHPCAYDAYGMTLVEAAAFGCPSLVNGGGAVGATELLGTDGCVQVNLAELEPEQLAQAVLEALGRPSALEAVAAAARERALGYDEAACGQKLLLALQGTAAA